MLGATGFRLLGKEKGAAVLGDAVGPAGWAGGTCPKEPLGRRGLLWQCGCRGDAGVGTARVSTWVSSTNITL